MPKGWVQGLIPWVIYFLLVGAGAHQMSVAVFAALLAVVVFTFQDLKGAHVVAWANLLMFMFLTLMIVVLKHAWFIEQVTTLSLHVHSWFASIIDAVFSL